MSRVSVYEMILNTVRTENPIKSNETLFDMLVNKVGILLCTYTKLRYITTVLFV